MGQITAATRRAPLSELAPVRDLSEEATREARPPTPMGGNLFLESNMAENNMMIMNKDYFVTACRYNQDRIPELFKKDTDYYQLRYRNINGSIVVASSGWDQTGWTELKNDSLLIVDRKDQSHSVVAI